MKKITLQDIATACAVSRVTVWKALNNHSGVSQNVRTKIFDTAINMGYPLNIEESGIELPQTTSTYRLKNRKSYSIAIVVSRPETSMFWGRIISGISNFLKKMDIYLSCLILPIRYTENDVLPEILTNGSIHGIIVMNIYEVHLFNTLNALPMPKVFLDCIPHTNFNTINGDLYLIEGRSTIEAIVEHVISQGITKIGFIGDINYAQTNYERYLGYCAAMNAHNISILDENCLIESFTIDAHPNGINKFLESRRVLPQMIVCVSDYIAQLAIQKLNLMGYCVPEDIMISGFDDDFEFNYAKNLTTVQTANMGVRLANQILYHLENPDADYELTYIRSKVIFRASTGNIPDTAHTSATHIN